ncbi:hypothetical protein AN958_10048 [Leucoagaricus sp. SymC.cos]|nr:hypothetical protein AN958_10048 [Leucoagaricus sp. SymC.cos]
MNGLSRIYDAIDHARRDCQESDSITRFMLGRVAGSKAMVKGMALAGVKAGSARHWDEPRGRKEGEIIMLDGQSSGKERWA